MSDNKQFVMVDCRAAKIFVTTCDSVGTYGPWVNNSESHEDVLDVGIDRVELGARVLSSLAKTRYGVPMPDYRAPEFAADQKRRLEKHGVKSEKEWSRGLASCTVWRCAENVKVTPHQKDSQGSSAMIKAAIDLTSPTPAELGEAIQQCLKIAAKAPDLPGESPGYGHT